MNRSKVGLVLLGLFCILFSLVAAKRGISSVYKIALDNQVGSFSRDGGAENSLFTHKLSDELIALNSYNPSNLLVVSYSKMMNGTLAGQVNVIDLNEARNLTLRAILLRPLDYVSYVRLAYIDMYLKEDFNKIRVSLEKAQSVGPYEVLTAAAGIDIYFSHWRHLETREKIIAFNYLVNYEKYGLTYPYVDQLVGNSPQFKYLCQVISVKRLGLPSCKKLQQTGE